MSRSSYALGLVSCVLALCGLAGCSSPDPNNALAQANSTNLQRLTNLYGAFQSQHNWYGPRNEADLKKFVREFNPKKLERIGINPGETDQIFVSERDGQPFKVRWGVRGSVMGCTQPVVFESTGVDGQRMVGFLDMRQEEVDATTYDQLWKKGAPAAPTGRKIAWGQ